MHEMMVDLVVLFEETNDGLFVDLEPSVIDDIRDGSLANLFDQEVLLNNKEDAANNFASGRYTVGEEIIHKVCDQTRKLVDNYDSVPRFVVNHHGVGCDTGSGLGALILDKKAVDCRLIVVKNKK